MQTTDQVAGEARAKLASKIENKMRDWSPELRFSPMLTSDQWQMILAALRAQPERGAEDAWRPIDQKPEDADWIIYLPDGAESGLGWALDPDERLAALLWWEETGPGRSEITHFRDPIKGPAAIRALPLHPAKDEGGGR